jgi:hypothetical protein
MLRHNSIVLLCYTMLGLHTVLFCWDCLIGHNDQKTPHDLHHWLEH